MAAHKSFDTDFFKTWEGDMAYVLGFLFADGSITKTERGGHYVSFHTMDSELLFAMRAAMRSEHKIAKRTARSGNVYRMQIGSKELVADLKKFGLEEAKAQRMRFPKIPLKYVSHFIRGFFDGDGNVWVGKAHLDRKRPLNVIQTAFTSASLEFLEGLKMTLRKQGMMGGSLVSLKGKQCGRLSFSIKDSLKLYEIMYNGSRTSLHLPRKKKVFEKYMKMQS